MKSLQNASLALRIPPLTLNSMRTSRKARHSWADSEATHERRESDRSTRHVRQEDSCRSIYWQLDGNPK